MKTSNDSIEQQIVEKKEQALEDEVQLNDEKNDKKDNERKNNENKTQKATERTNQTKILQNITNKTTINHSSETSEEFMFFQKRDKSEDNENMDIIYDQLNESDQHDDDDNESEIYERLYETDPEDQAYHVEEKRIKIIRDSQ